MSDSNQEKKVRKYLKNQTKEELIDLILRIAPPSFFENMSSELANQKEAQEILREASNAIDKILADEMNLYDPSKFENKLLKQLEKIRGLWDKFPSQIGDLLIKIMEKIEEAFEEGYLYIENYHKEDEYFESEEVNEYIYRFTKTLPEEMKFNYRERLKRVLENYGFSTFQSLERKL